MDKRTGERGWKEWVEMDRRTGARQDLEFMSTLLSRYVMQHIALPSAKFLVILQIDSRRASSTEEARREDFEIKGVYSRFILVI